MIFLPDIAATKLIYDPEIHRPERRASTEMLALAFQQEEEGTTAPCDTGIADDLALGLVCEERN